MYIVKKIIILSLIMAMSLLSACGFHLQGKYKFSPKIKNLIITLDEYSLFGKLLIDSFIQNGINIVNKSTDHKFAVLEINSPIISEEIHSYDSKGQVSQYRLIANCNYTLFATDGTKLRENSITRRRIYSVNANQLLSNANEQQVISEELNIEIVNELLKQLSSTCS